MLINISNLTFCYDGSYDDIFKNLSISIDTDWRIGLVGRNGKGKTTLLKLLMNEYEYSGTINAPVSFDYFPFNVKNKELDTLDVLLQINSQVYEWEILREFSFLDLKEEILYRKFNTLSNGEQTKALLSILFLKQNGFLLIDEPTNHLDIEARKVVAKYLKSKKGFILVSHDREFLDESVNHILAINKNNVELQKGNYSSYEYNKKLVDNFEIKQNDKIKKDIKRLDNSKKNIAIWSDKIEASKIGNGSVDRGFIGHKSAKMMKRSKNVEKRIDKYIEEKNTLLKNIDISEDLKIHCLEYYKDELIKLNNVQIFYDNNQILSNINFTVNSGDRLFLIGKNGTGKSSLLKLIMGENINYKGNINIGKNLKISYVFQDVSNLKGSLKDYINKFNINETLFKTILRKLDFSRDMFDKNLETYSQGQKKKVLISKSLAEEAHLYIWDEPLNYIDILSREQIENLILKFKPTIIFVEHDSRFIENVATKIINI